MYKKHSKGWLKHSDFVLLDLICMQAAFIIAYLLRHKSGNPYETQLYLNMDLSGTGGYCCTFFL